MILDILANGAPTPWRRKNDGKDSEKNSGPPRRRERVWHSAIGYIFDERRAAPPAYGRRAWSKVVSYLRKFSMSSDIDQSLGVA